MNVRYMTIRTVQMVFTVIMAISLSFFLIRLMPGGPMDYIRQQILQEREEQGGGDVQEKLERVERMEQYLSYNVSEPMYIQYVEYVTSILTGDFGQSYWFNEPVVDILMKALPWTVFLVSWISLASFASSILLGALMAFYERSKFDKGLTVGQMILGAIPYYVYAVLLIAFLAYRWEVFPAGGRIAHDVTPGYNLEFMQSLLYHAALPWISMVIGAIGGSLAMRGNSIQVLGTDYLRIAKIRGISTGRLTTRYITHNAILPMYTGFLMGIAGFFSGSVILEQIFAYPGMGYYTIEAFRARDYPLMMGNFIMLTTLTLFGIYLADLTYGLVDPRIKTGDENESF